MSAVRDPMLPRIVLFHHLSALSDWAKALYGQLQDCPNNETGWEITEEAGKKLTIETIIAVKDGWRNRGIEDAQEEVQRLYDDAWLQDNHTKLIIEKLEALKR